MDTQNLLRGAFAFEPNEKAGYRLAENLTVVVRECIWTVDGVFYRCDFPNGQASGLLPANELMSLSYPQAV
jgi:hypothetical protein